MVDPSSCPVYTNGYKVPLCVVCIFQLELSTKCTFLYLSYTLIIHLKSFVMHLFSPLLLPALIVGSVSAAALSEPRVNIVISIDEVCHVSISCAWPVTNMIRANNLTSIPLRTIATGSWTIVRSIPCLSPPVLLLEKKVSSLEVKHGISYAMTIFWQWTSNADRYMID